MTMTRVWLAVNIDKPTRKTTIHRNPLDGTVKDTCLPWIKDPNNGSWRAYPTIREAKLGAGKSGFPGQLLRPLLARREV